MITLSDRADATRDTLARARIVPLVTFTDASTADAVADALLSGGITAIEVALRSPAAPEALERLGRRHDITVGAGTVTTAREAAAVAGLGAQFTASPGWNEQVAEAVADAGMLPIPGIATATEVQAAVAVGLTFLKLFPAELTGGTDFLGAMQGPFPNVTYLASGGISLANASEYLRHSAVIAVSGSWIAPRHLIESGAWGAIEENARVASRLVREVEASR